MLQPHEEPVTRRQLYGALAGMTVLILFTHGFAGLEQPWIRLVWSAALLLLASLFTGLAIREALRR